MENVFLRRPKSIKYTIKEQNDIDKEIDNNKSFCSCTVVYLQLNQVWSREANPNLDSVLIHPQFYEQGGAFIYTPDFGVDVVRMRASF